MVRALNKKLESIVEEKNTEMQDKEEQFVKIEKGLKDEIIELRSTELHLMNDNDTLKSELERNKKET